MKTTSIATSIDTSIERSLTPPKKTWITWLVFLLVALVIHFLFFVIHWENLIPKKPNPVEIFRVDPEKLEKVRNQWKEKEKSLLLNPNKELPSEISPPENARYFSDKNIKVHKETKAKDTAVLPTPGKFSPMDSTKKTSPEKLQDNIREKSKPIPATPALKDLGVPIPLKNGKPKPVEQLAQGPRGGQQAILDRSLPEGSENMLNAQESVYYSYYARIYETIGPLWQSRINEVAHIKRIPPGEYITVVDIVFDTAGNLQGVHFIKYSGISEFDHAVEYTWRKASRFPNPPSGLINTHGEIHTGWTFSVRVGGNFGLQYLPPERNY